MTSYCSPSKLRADRVLAAEFAATYCDCSGWNGGLGSSPAAGPSSRQKSFRQPDNVCAFCADPLDGTRPRSLEGYEERPAARRCLTAEDAAGMDERHRLSTAEAKTGGTLVSAAPARGLLQLARALVAEEVVARDDVVHAQALGAGEALAHVALQQVTVVDDVLAATVLEPVRADVLLARLAADRRFHRRGNEAPALACGGTIRGTIAQVPHGTVRGDEAPPPSPRAVPERYNARPLGTDGPTTRADGATPMKRTLAALLAVGLLAGPALAQSKLDQAIAKAEDQIAKGKPDEAIKTMTKAAAEAGPEGQVALARLQERVGNLDAAAAAYDQAKARRRQQPGRPRRRRELHAAPGQGAGRARPREAGRGRGRDPGRARARWRARRCGWRTDRALSRPRTRPWPPGRRARSRTSPAARP